jgi:uncharacterized protein
MPEIDTPQVEEELQYRCFKGEVRLLDGTNKIGGYATVYNDPSEDLGGYREIIEPGAFDQYLRSKPVVLCLYNHNPDILLGSTFNGSLTLREDQRGLFYECTPPDNQQVRDLLALIRGGYLAGSSIGFRATKREKTIRDGQVVQIVSQAKLYDCSPVTVPAYSNTTIAARHLQLTKLCDRIEKMNARIKELNATDTNIV